MARYSVFAQVGGEGEAAERRGSGVRGLFAVHDEAPEDVGVAEAGEVVLRDVRVHGCLCKQQGKQLWVVFCADPLPDRFGSFWYTLVSSTFVFSLGGFQGLENSKSPLTVRSERRSEN